MRVNCVIDHYNTNITCSRNAIFKKGSYLFDKTTGRSLENEYGCLIIIQIEINHELLSL